MPTAPDLALTFSGYMMPAWGHKHPLRMQQTKADSFPLNDFPGATLEPVGGQKRLGNHFFAQTLSISVPLPLSYERSGLTLTTRLNWPSPDRVSAS